MKINLAFALATVLAASTLMAAPAADKDKKDDAAAEQEGPTPAQLKARKLVKAKPIQMKFDAAKKLAEDSGLPMLVAVLPDKSAMAVFVEKQILKRKEFVLFAGQNFVISLMKVKTDGKNPKKIDARPLKESEVKFLENYAVSERAIADAKRLNKDEPKYTDMVCYPMVMCVDSMCQKELFRLGPADRDAGFGVWISQFVDSLKTAGIEPVITPAIQNMIDNPDDKKWKFK